MQSKPFVPPQGGSEAPSIPDNVRVALANAFPDEEIGAAAPTFGGYSNLTVVLPIGGRLAVAKIAHTVLKRADVRREARLLAALHDTGLPTPELVTLLEGDGFTVEVMNHINGTNGMRFFSEEQNRLPALYAAVGRTLGAVHRHRLADSDRDLDLAPRYRQAQNALGLLQLPPTLENALHGALAHPIWQRPGDRLVHGDAGLHNLLWDGQLRALLDWEWAGRGLPLFDLAWTAWIMRFRNLDDSLWDGFLAAYRSATDQQPVATADELRALALGQIAFILTRTDSGSWARDEWQRRAEATVTFAFPAL